MFYKRWIWTSLVIIFAFLLLSSCQQSSDTVPVKPTRLLSTETAVSTSTAVPQVEPAILPTETAVSTTQPEANTAAKDLAICLPSAIDSVYPYNGKFFGEEGLRAAIYETEITTFSYDYQPRGIEKLPNLADGDAVINAIEVNTGDFVLDTTGIPVELKQGVSIIDADGEVVLFDGTPIVMEQISANFTLKPRIWSDGEPVKASDSVFSFQIASHPDTPSDKFNIERTANYEATGDLTLRWTGIPGFLDPTYFTNIWQPLPEHHLGKFTPAELLEVEEANHLSVSDGAYMIEEWDERGIIRVVPNPYYYRQDEGLPYLDSVTYKFHKYDTNSLIANLLAPICEIGTRDTFSPADLPFLNEAQIHDATTIYYQAGQIWEHIDFGIDSYGDYANSRPDWFEDVRVRQAMTMCTDRQRMVDEILHGTSQIMHTYIPIDHPLYAEANVIEWPYDVEAANALLDEVGFVDNDGDGLREYTDGTPFSITLGSTSGGTMREQANTIFQENMRDCGIEVELYFLVANEWFARAPESPLFGRQFDLGGFAWIAGIEPNCQHYSGLAISGPLDEGFAGWEGTNATGWHNKEYDDACNQARSSFYGTATYLENHQEAVRIFSEQLPIIPLFQRPIIAATDPEVLNFSIDPTVSTELQNIYMFDIEQ